MGLHVLQGLTLMVLRCLSLQDRSIEFEVSHFPSRPCLAGHAIEVGLIMLHHLRPSQLTLRIPSRSFVDIPSPLASSPTCLTCFTHLMEIAIAENRFSSFRSCPSSSSLQDSPHPESIPRRFNATSAYSHYRYGRRYDEDGDAGL